VVGCVVNRAVGKGRLLGVQIPRHHRLVLGSWNVTSLAGKEPEPVQEVERYQLDMVGLTSTHSWMVDWRVCSNYRGNHTASSPRESLFQATGKEASADCRTSTSGRTMWIQSVLEYFNLIIIFSV